MTTEVAYDRPVSDRLGALPAEVQESLLGIWTRATAMTTEEREMGRVLLGGLCIVIALAEEPRHINAGHLVADANSVLVFVDDLSKEGATSGHT